MRSRASPEGELAHEMVGTRDASPQRGVKYQTKCSRVCGAVETSILVGAMLVACNGTVVTSGGAGKAGAGGSTTLTSSTGATTGAGATTGSSTTSSTDPGVCVFGMDQTCNDDLSVSAVWGTCQEDGTCTCNPGFEVNPSTGHCRPMSDGGAPNCGDQTCKDNEFCVERVHSQDAGPVPSTWQCQIYFQCMEHTCPCALQNFVSASCVNPTCQSEGPPVLLRCDDLN